MISPFLRRLARRSLPQVSGELRLPSLEAPVEVIRDRYGIPHVYAGSRHDLVRAQGYVHAQDRLWQMESLRRFAFGRLAELAGRRALELDRLARRLRLRWSAERDAEACDPEAASLVEAYCDGVNAFLAHGPLPLELRLARIRPEPWTPVDVQAPGQMFALALSGNWEGELARAALVSRLGPERAALLDPSYPADHPLVLSDALARAAAGSPLAGRTGTPASNAFAVAGTRTASGKPIVANDPHLLLGIPGIWHAQHLTWDEGEAWGATVPGAPVVILGRNRRLAWGMTTAMIDTQDLYVERIRPGDPPRYEADGEWPACEVVREEIRVRGRREPAVEDVLVTRHGPLVVPPEDGEGLALRWSAYEPGETTRALLDLMTASSVEEGDRALDRFAAPPHNFVLADDAGSIGYRLAGGPLPRRRPSAGQLPAPGWDSSHEWGDWIPQDELPRARDPERGFLVSANNRIVGDEYPYPLPGEYLSGYRARRLEELIAERALTADGAAEILLDRRSLPGLELAELARGFEPSGPLEAEALRQLAGWDGELGPESPGGAVYGALMGALERLVLADAAEDGVVPTRILERGRPAVLRALRDRDERLLPAGRTWDEVIAEALAAAVAELEPDPSAWRRGRLHSVRLGHGLDSIPGLGRYLGRGPFEVGGDADTVHVMAHTSGLAAHTMIGPSMRAVYDLGDPDGTLLSLVPGQSGHPASPHYDDLAPGWLAGEYVPFATSRADVDALAEARLALLPE